MYIYKAIHTYIYIFIHTYAEIIGAESVCEASTVLPIYIYNMIICLYSG